MSTQCNPISTQKHINSCTVTISDWLNVVLVRTELFPPMTLLRPPGGITIRRVCWCVRVLVCLFVNMCWGLDISKTVGDRGLVSALDDIFDCIFCAIQIRVLIDWLVRSVPPVSGGCVGRAWRRFRSLLSVCLLFQYFTKLWTRDWKLIDVSFLPRNALKCICAVLGSHDVRLSVCPSVCDVGDLWSHRLEISETNCTDN